MFHVTCWYLFWLPEFWRPKIYLESKKLKKQYKRQNMNK
jgi:hypothetical protein